METPGEASISLAVMIETLAGYLSSGTVSSRKPRAGHDHGGQSTAVEVGGGTGGGILGRRGVNDGGEREQDRGRKGARHFSGLSLPAKARVGFD